MLIFAWSWAWKKLMNFLEEMQCNDFLDVYHARSRLRQIVKTQFTFTVVTYKYHTETFIHIFIRTRESERKVKANDRARYRWKFRATKRSRLWDAFDRYRNITTCLSISINDNS